MLNMVAALITIVRGRPMDDHEQSVLSAVLHHLRERAVPGRSVLLPDVLRVLTDGPDRVRAVTLDRGSDTRYRDAVDPLHRSLLGILDGPLGDTFASETSTRIDANAPAVCIDISGIGEADTQLTAAAMLAAWSDGLGTVAASHALADAGLAPRRWFFTVLDELWRPLRAASGIVDRIDALTRLNRSLGLGDAKITHTLKDAEALGTDADRAKARGFVERAGMVVCAGLPKTEMEDLGKVVGLSRREIELVSSWSSPPGWGVRGEDEEPPGAAASSSRSVAAPASRSRSPSPTPSATCTTPTPAGRPTRRPSSRPPPAPPRKSPGARRKDRSPDPPGRPGHPRPPRRPGLPRRGGVGRGWTA